MIKIEHLSKGFAENIAVNDLCLEIPRGELFAFLGPNAAGKTTTIKLLVGLLKPTKGKIMIDKYDLSKDYIQAKQLISYVPDVPYLYDKLTGEEFLYFVGNLYGFDNQKIKHKIAQLLELFGLNRFSRQLIEDYSHGLRQRLIMCAAFIHDPSIILIDEPLVGLDPRSAKLLKDILKTKASQGTTIFMSTHTLPIAEELADRIGIIDRGRLIALGTIKQLQKMSGVDGHLEDVFLKLTKEQILT